MKVLISALAFGLLALAVGFGDCKKDKQGEEGLTVAVLGEDCKDKDGEDSFVFVGDGCKDKDGEDSIAVLGDGCKDKDGEDSFALVGDGCKDKDGEELTLA